MENIKTKAKHLFLLQYLWMGDNDWNRSLYFADETESKNLKLNKRSNNFKNSNSRYVSICIETDNNKKENKHALTNTHIHTLTEKLKTFS